MKKIRIIEILIIIISIRLTPVAIEYANSIRHYKAYGGECLLPLFGVLVAFAIETAVEIISEMKKGQNDV